jgi:Transposase IS116/IS110/IS902 family
MFHALCAAERPMEVLLVNARHVKNVPGRKSDALDAVWLAELTECGLLRGSFIPPQNLRVTIPGISERSAQVVISEIGVDMTRFPTAAHLASWAGLCSGNNESAGKHRSGRTRKGNTELRTVLTDGAWAARQTSTYVGAQFRRFHRRFGSKGGKKAAIATAHTLIVIIWHVLAETAAYRDLGSDYFTRHIDSPEARKRRLIHELEALGHKVTTEPAATLATHQHRSPTNPTRCRVTNPCAQNVPGHHSYVAGLRHRRELSEVLTRTPVGTRYRPPTAGRSARRTSPRSTAPTRGRPLAASVGPSPCRCDVDVNADVQHHGRVAIDEAGRTPVV